MTTNRQRPSKTKPATKRAGPAAGVEWQLLFDTLNEPIMQHDTEYRIVRCNRAYAQAAGQPRDQLIGRPYWQVFPRQNGPLTGCRAAMDRRFHSSEEQFMLPNGRIYMSRGFPITGEDGQPLGGAHLFEDVTERWKVTQALDAAERRLRTIIETEQDGILVVNEKGTVLYANPAVSALLGRAAEDLLGAPLGLPLSGEGTNELELLPAKRESVVAEMRTSRLEWAGEPAYLIVLHDITIRKRSEERLRRINRTYAVLSASNHTLVSTQGEQALFGEFCRHLVHIGGYRFAWFGYARHDEQRSIEPAAWAGEGQDYLEHIQLTWGDIGWELDPAGEAIRSAATRVHQDLANDAKALPWSTEALARRFAAALGLPVRIDKGVIGALCIYADQAGVFDPEEIKLLEELATDLAFGLQTLRTRLARAEAEALLHIRNSAIEASLNGIVILDSAAAGAPIIDLNPAFTRITGYAREEALGRPVEFLCNQDLRQAELPNIQTAIAHHRAATALLRNYRKDGSLFWNELHIAPVRSAAGQVTHYIGILNDLTEHKRYEEQLEYQAQHDALTGLPNRILMLDRLGQSLALAGRQGRAVAILFADLDHFKEINDSLGHAVGDRVLQEMALRLQRCVRGGETVSRYGGDEFVIVLPDLDKPLAISQAAERFIAALAKPLWVSGQEIQTTASLGAAIFPRDGREAETLLRNADAAMYQAKEQGRNLLHFYTLELNERLRERLRMRSQMRQALERDELRLQFQPQIALSTGAIVGFEALLRWQQQAQELTYPDQFIPLAEESGMIVTLGEWVLAMACKQAKAWQTAGLPPISMAVNVSARQLSELGLVAQVERALRMSGLEPRFLELELTENSVARDPEAMGQRLVELKRLGVSLATDDFGTGYSSLSYLSRFPFDKLKIDRSFVTSLTTSPQAAKVAVSIIAMAHSMDMTVVAEGGESCEQVQFLEAHGCDQLQGFYFSPPLDADDAGRLLQQGKRLDKLRPWMH